MRALEASTVLSVGEKIELLLLFLHKKWAAEVDVGLSRKDASIAELERLGLPWRIDSRNGASPESWVQVGANQAVLDYLKERRDQLSEMEAGMLYGFPLTHVLGFSGLIHEKVAPPVDTATYMLAGVYSHNFYTQEVAHFRQIWREVEKASPALAKQSEERYGKMRAKFGKT
ncbi:hypothetical protein [Streptomyces aquilus]|uniref:hypothetical protein n=1 Tax=Streptomyces aquilus TaxID=2548456 RepID=UPI0036794B84